MAEEKCGRQCSLTEDQIDCFNVDDFDEISDLMSAHSLNPDAADDVAQAQVLLRQHVQQMKEQVSGSNTLTHDTIGTLVRDHHKRRMILLQAAKKVMGFVDELPKARVTELKRYYPKLDEELKRKVKELEEEKSLFIVAGESGSGKSYLINMLMNQTDGDFLPVSTLPSTSCMCDISYGDPGKITAYSPGSETSMPVIENLTEENVAEKLSTFTHQKVDREKIQYNRVEVQWPCEWLKGINLVDTPGVGENDEMTSLVKEMMPKAVGFIYVINTQKAGGIQPEELEDLLLQQIRFQEGSRLPGEVFDPSTAIFVFNKWDTIDNDEKEKVKAFVLNKLKMVWSGLNPHTQMFFVSVKQAHESMKSNVIPKDYINMLNGIERMIDLSLRCKMKRHYGYLAAVLERCKYILSMYLNSYPNMAEEYESAKKKLKDLSSKTKRVKDKIRDTFRQETEKISSKMKAHLEREDVRTRLRNWAEGDCPHSTDVERAAKVMAKKKVYEEIKEWEGENAIFATVQKTLLDIFQEEFLSLKYDLSAIESSLQRNNSSTIKQWLRNVGATEEDSNVFQILKMVFKSISVSIITAMLGLSGWGIIEGVSAIYNFIRRRRQEQTLYKEYKSGTISLQELMSRETLTVIEGICNGSNLQSSFEETFEGMVVTMNAMLKVIPEFVDADRALLIDLQRQLEEGLKPEIVSQCTGLEENVEILQGILDCCYLLHIEKLDIPFTNLDIDWKRRLGGGTFGEVYKGNWKQDDRDTQVVAVKLIKEGITAENATEVRSEIQFLRATSDNVNIVDYFGISVFEKTYEEVLPVPCLVFEMCDTSLEKVIYNRAKYDPPGRMLDEGIIKERAFTRMANYAMQIANGLVALHKFNFVHRDLKPANILVKLIPDSGPTGVTEILKLCDFGFTKSEDYITNSDKGTLLYMAPQVFNREHYGKEVDMFSYGLTVLELYYGTVTYKLEFVEVQLQPTRFTGDPFALNKPEEGWVDIISRCWSEDPKIRPTALECHKFFKEQQTGSPV